ncbi:MAG: LysR family transcriptional regulator [Faecousia sp.]
MSVNLEYYRAFYYVATLGSMSKAAEHMCLTPPTVTKTIQTLEQQLGCQLFTRYAKGVRLTSAGETLFLRVKPGINLLEAGEREVNMLNSLEGGTVKIAMSEAAAHYFTMPAVLVTFCTKYPKVHLVIKHLPSSKAQEAVLAGDIDFAILGIRADQDLRDFDIHKIYRSDNVPVVGKAYKFLAKQPVGIDKLVNYPLVFTSTGYSIREYYEDLYKKYGYEFRPNIETPTLDLQLQAVRLGLGYSFFPYPHVKEAVEQGDLFVLKMEAEKMYERTVSLLTAKDVPMSRAAQALIDVLLEASSQYCV